MPINREARLREVLAEVNMLDLLDATKAIFTQWGCLKRPGFSGGSYL